MKRYITKSSSNDAFERMLEKHDIIDHKAKLEVCPFCKGPAELCVTRHIPQGYDFTPRCKDPSCCGRLTKKFTSRETAISKWNMSATTNARK